MMGIQDEWEYKRLVSMLDRQGDNGRERLQGYMADKIYHSGRGGYRGGVKPKIPKHLRREHMTVRLPRWMIDRLQDMGDSLTATVERIIAKHVGEPPQDKGEDNG